jgi:propanol-preferring alcohol dehydrogenase
VLDLQQYGAVRNATLRPDINVVIVGTGGLGLMAIHLARAVTGINKFIIMMLIDSNHEMISRSRRFDYV